MTTHKVTNSADLIDQQLEALFHAAGPTGVNLSDLYALPEEDPSISRDMIYDALQRAKRKSRLGVEAFVPDPSRAGKIWYRLPLGSTT